MATRKHLKKKRSVLPTMADTLLALFTPDHDAIEYGFLKDCLVRGHHTHLLGAIQQSNLRPAVQAVLFGLILGKIKRARGALPKQNTSLKDMQRALHVLDIERSDVKRESAVTQAASELGCSKKTIQNALSKHESDLRRASPATIKRLRAINSDI